MGGGAEAGEGGEVGGGESMKVQLVFGVFLVCAPFVWAQDSSFPDISDFTKSPTEHIINQVYEPFQVKSVRGTITFYGSDEGVPKVLFEIEGPGSQRTIRHGLTDSHGQFRISRVPQGRYRFKATLNAYQSVVGTIVVSKHAAKSAAIAVQMHVGV
jgi:hypothetical protein